MSRYRYNRGQRSDSWFRRQLRQRPKPAWMVIVTDILLIAVSLVVFALFHHVLPRNEASLGVISSRESAGANHAMIGTVEDTDGGDGSVDEDSDLDLSQLTAESVSFSDDGDAQAEPDGEGTAAEPDAAEPDGEGTAAAPDDGAEPDATGAAEAGAADTAQPDEAADAEGDGEGAADMADALSLEVPGYFGDKFADKFTTGEVIKSQTGYQSENVNITLRRYTYKHAVFYVADIYIRDITCLVSAFAKGTYGKGIRDWAGNILKDVQGIIAINGDYYGGRSDGVVIRNGELYRSDSYLHRDVCVLFWDGTMETYGGGKFNAKAAIDAGAYQAWNFGPRLLDSDGKPKTQFNSDVGPENPRTALGYFEPGHYCFVVVDGRQDNSRGLTLSHLSKLMYELGCVRAYNMDGGNTSVMVAGSKVVNNPSGGGRATTDIIAIVDN